MSSDQKTPNRFDTMASSWDENPVVLKLTKAVARKIIEHVPLDNSMRALEFGCGTGLVTVQLAYKVGTVTALDSSEKMLEELSRKLEMMDIGNVFPHMVDIAQDTLPAGPFSFVFSNMTMHHIDRVGSLFKQVYDCMAPGGGFAVADLDTEDGSFHGDMEGVFHHGFPRDGFISLLENAGFSNCIIQDAHVVEKENPEGQLRSYPMFLATAFKK